MYHRIKSMLNTILDQLKILSLVPNDMTLKVYPIKNIKQPNKSSIFQLLLK